MTIKLLLALLATTALVPVAAFAQVLPQGGEVRAGEVVIQTPSPTQLRIDQASKRAVVNWQSFSVGEGARVDIHQPDAQSALLNRVTGNTTSEIAGQITANGRVFLVNPNGILITATGSVSAAGFTASTLDIADRDFMAGSDEVTVTARRVDQPVRYLKDGFAGALKGDARGLVRATLREAGTGAALDLGGDGFLQVKVPDAGVTVAGRITASEIVLTAGSARAAARGVVNVTGTLDASSVSARGGTITLGGAEVKLAGATLDASGALGGGSIRAGGDWLGGGSMARATTASVDAATTIRADATGTGDGGRIVVWADDHTSFTGHVSAKGANGGAGGDAEVSGKATLAFTGTADLTGATFGTLLLDPYNITISGAADSNQSGFTATGNESVINATTLTAALAGANVTVSTGTGGTQAGNITLAAGTPLSWNTGATLTLQAAGAVTLNSAISAAAGGLTIQAGTGTSTAAADLSVARFTLASGDWVQNAATLPAFATADFRITGGSFLRAAGGVGTAASPYLLTDVHGLQGMGSSTAYRAASYRLAGDIDARGTATWNNQLGFVPIGRDDLIFGFGGRLNGAGYIVTGLIIFRPSIDNVGLIGILGPAGSVTNIGLVGGSITGRDRVGELAGANYGTVSSAYATGTVTGRNDVGGLVGSNYSTVNTAYATGVITGSDHVGGLVGYNYANSAYLGEVSNAYATGSVNGGNVVGGLVGYNQSGTVTNAYATGTATGSNYVGGLVGYNGGLVGYNHFEVTRPSLVTNAYATGGAIGGNYVGGLAGYNSGTMSSAYATGSVTTIGSGSGTIYAGGLVGYNYGGIRNTYFDIETTGRTEAVGGGGSFGGTALTTAQARSQASYTQVIGGLTHRFDFNAVWFQAGDLRPILRSEAAAAVDGVILVSNLHQLQLMGANLNASYRLARDIDATATAGTNAAGVFGAGGFVPVGADDGITTPFYGNLDGAGRIVTGLTITRPTTFDVGLIGALGPGGSVANIGLVGGSVTGTGSVGALVGFNRGSVTASYSSASVTAQGAQAQVGGLVGWNLATVSQSYATGAVRSTSDYGVVGGLVGVGHTGSSVSQSYATGAVSTTGQGFVGGLLGYTYGSVDRSYATGAVSASNGSSNIGGISRDVGGLVGTTFGDASISLSYATGPVSVTGSAGSNVGGLVGLLGGGNSIDRSYATGAVSVTGTANSVASDHVGGLAGYATAGSSISQSYATGAVGAAGNFVGSVVGGVAGYGDGALTNVYWDTTTSGRTNAVGVGTGTQANVAGRTTAQMQDLTAFRTTYAGFDFTNVWAPPNQVGQGGQSAAYYPELYVLSNVVAVTPADASRLYGNANPVLGAGASYAGIRPGDLVAAPGTFTTAATASSDVGNYTITGSGTAVTSTVGRSYRIVYVPGTLTVTQRPVTVTAVDGSRTYGNANPALSYGSTSLGAGAAPNGTLATLANPGSNVGSYAITQGTLNAANNPNYALTYVGSILTVTPRALVVTPDAVARVYGAANPARGTPTGEGLVNGDTVASVALVSPASGTSNVGSYALTGADAQGTGLANYTIGYATLSDGLSVTARPISIAADSLARLYGDANPALTYTVGGLGLVNGDTLSGALATAATATSAVGGYAITQGTLAASANYAVTGYTGAVLGVAQRPVTVTATAATRTYGDANPALAFTTTSLGAGASLAGGLTTAATIASGVGGYAIAQGSVTAAANPNYALSYIGAILSVTPRALLVTPDAISRTYGDATPARGTASAGLVNGDTLASVALTTPATAASGIGAYALGAADAQGTGLANYTISYATLADGLTILARPLAIAANPLSRVYGDANPALGYTLGGGGLVNGDTLSGALATGATAASGIGGYAIGRGTLAASANYSVTFTGATLTVTPRPLTIAADPLSRLSGQANPALTYTLGGRGLANGDALTGTLATTASLASAPGSYPILPGSLAASVNYAVSYLPGTLTVGRPLPVATGLTAGTQQRDGFAAGMRPNGSRSAAEVDRTGDALLTYDDTARPAAPSCPPEQMCPKSEPR